MTSKFFKIGKIIKFFRYINDISIKELSERTGISITYLTEIERGKKYNISIDKLTELSKGLKISSSSLMEIIELAEDNDLPDKVLFLYIMKLNIENEVKTNNDFLKHELVRKLLK